MSNELVEQLLLQPQQRRTLDPDGFLIVGIDLVFFTLIETEKQMRLAFRNPDSGEGIDLR